MLNSQIRSIISWWKRLCHKLLLNSALKAHLRIHILQLRVTFSNRMVKRMKALKATSLHRVVKVSYTAIILGKWRRLNLYISLGIFLARAKHWCTWNTWPIKVNNEHRNLNSVSSLPKRVTMASQGKSCLGGTVCIFLHMHLDSSFFRI